MSQSFGIEELEKQLAEDPDIYPLHTALALAYLNVLKDCELHCYNEGLEVKNLGGLHVIGTSLHESRRIDNQVSSYCLIISKKLFKTLDMQIDYSVLCLFIFFYNATNVMGILSKNLGNHLSLNVYCNCLCVMSNHAVIFL